MVYRGHVENGVIRLEEPLVLPEGAEVRVELAAFARGEAAVRGLYDRLKPVIGPATSASALVRPHAHAKSRPEPILYRE